MRAVVYYGGQRLKTTPTPNYDLLYSLLDLVTTLDPRFNIAYRFGAIFLAEAYPSGPGRPDQAIALLQRGIDRTGRWEYMHDIGFVYYWWLRDYPKAAEWFERAAAVPGSPAWLKPLAATTLAVGGDRSSSRMMWQQLHDSSDTEWLRIERRVPAHAARRDGPARRAQRGGGDATPLAWAAWRRAGRRWAPRCGLRGVPLDPAGVPLVINPSTGRIGLSRGFAALPAPGRAADASRRSSEAAAVTLDTPQVLMAGLFGLLIGSFLNVVIHRLPRGQSLRLAALDLPRLRLPHPSDRQRAGAVVAAARR